MATHAQAAYIAGVGLVARCHCGLKLWFPPWFQMRLDTVYCLLYGFGTLEVLGVSFGKLGRTVRRYQPCVSGRS